MGKCLFDYVIESRIDYDWSKKAQGITLGIVLTAAILTHGKSNKQSAPYDHSWEDIVDREEEERKRLKERKA